MYFSLFTSQSGIFLNIVLCHFLVYFTAMVVQYIIIPNDYMYITNYIEGLKPEQPMDCPLLDKIS